MYWFILYLATLPVMTPFEHNEICKFDHKSRSRQSKRELADAWSVLSPYGIRISVFVIGGAIVYWHV
jgi:hypothetical protein